MTTYKQKEWRRPRRYAPRKEFDFIPNKDQIINGAFLDLGKPINKEKHLKAAIYIAAQYNEEI